MIQYGIQDHYIDVTAIARERLVRDDWVYIPTTDAQRACIFGDPLVGVVKHVKVTSPYGYEVICPIDIPTKISLDYTQILPNWKYTLAVVAVTQREARFLREWIEFHRLVGVEHFYLYDNESPDETRAVLQPYIDQDIVTYKLWAEPNAVVMEGRRDGLKHARLESQWVAVIDTDEFIVPNQVDDLRVLLRKYTDYGALVVNWYMFGTSGVESIPPDKIMLECLTRSIAPADAQIEWTPGKWQVVNRHVKSIINSRYLSHMCGPHHAYYRSGKYAVNSQYARVDEEYGSICTVDLQLNHYFFRDRQFIREVKLERRNRYFKDIGLPVGESVEGYTQTDETCSSTVNLSAQRFIEPLRQRLSLPSTSGSAET